MNKKIKLTSILISVIILLSGCKKDPPPPIADFSFSGGNTILPSEVIFTNSSANANTYTWEFGDGFSSKDENPRHSYTREGTFTVKLTAEGEGGTNSISKSVTIVEPEPTAAVINFTVVGDQDLEQTIYPSVILGLANLTAKYNEDFFKLSVKNPKANTNLKLVIQASSLNSETIFQTQMANRGQVYTFSPLIKWNYTYLRLLKQPGNVDLTFICYINDKEIDRKNLRLSYRSVNECVFGYIDAKGVYQDMSWMFAAYVNEDNPKIDELLQTALASGIVSSFKGYQGTETDVFNQVFAIWYFLQSKGVKYSSITTTSNPSSKVYSQYVRFFDEVYNNTQANCADGSIFLASILKKIALKPFLVCLPEHMYIGYYSVSDKSKFWLLETTMVGNVNLSEIYEDTQYVYNLEKYRSLISDETWNKYFGNTVSLNYVKMEISYNSFLKATDWNRDSYNSDIPNFNDPSNHLYNVFDIDALRKIVQPIGNKK